MISSWLSSCGAALSVRPRSACGVVMVLSGWMLVELELELATMLLFLLLLVTRLPLLLVLTPLTLLRRFALARSSESSLMSERRRGVDSSVRMLKLLRDDMMDSRRINKSSQAKETNAKQSEAKQNNRKYGLLLRETGLI